MRAPTNSAAAWWASRMPANNAWRAGSGCVVVGAGVVVLGATVGGVGVVVGGEVVVTATVAGGAAMVVGGARRCYSAGLASSSWRPAGGNDQAGSGERDRGTSEAVDTGLERGGGEHAPHGPRRSPLESSGDRRIATGRLPSLRLIPCQPKGGTAITADGAKTREADPVITPIPDDRDARLPYHRPRTR